MYKLVHLETQLRMLCMIKTISVGDYEWCWNRGHMQKKRRNKLHISALQIKFANKFCISIRIRSCSQMFSRVWWSPISRNDVMAMNAFRIIAGPFNSSGNSLVTSEHQLCILQSLPVSALQWRHNGRNGVSNHWPQQLIQPQIKENIKAPRHWPLCGPVTRKMLQFDDVIMRFIGGCIKITVNWVIIGLAMVCGLFIANPIPEAVMACNQLDLKFGQIGINIKYFRYREYIWKIFYRITVILFESHRVE